MGESIFEQAPTLSPAGVMPASDGSLPRSELLQIEQLSAVAGGLNPQPLPPYRRMSM